MREATHIRHEPVVLQDLACILEALARLAEYSPIRHAESRARLVRLALTGARQFGGEGGPGLKDIEHHVNQLRCHDYSREFKTPARLAGKYYPLVIMEGGGCP